MFEIFTYVEKFFSSLVGYMGFNEIFITFIGLFLVSMIVVFISTSHAYEAKLIKAIDKFNAYFIDNPHINEDNLVAFNEKMKSSKVPKQLRKSWQQYVLYRDKSASEYMSFANCVENPIKHSSYKRDIKVFNYVAYILAAISLVLNCFRCYESVDLANILQNVLLTPVIILLLNYCCQIYLNARHSAIVSDLFQNYQYFEVNIDKATQTLPDYVDYEVLFDKVEIKKGIPILYQYLQKRAEEEQRELELARLKNIEHEKFNFDETGVAASLVLERAMQEAENYIAERKKYTQDTQQINSDMTQEDIDFRETTKEYNRQMQVSKETFANLKSQLEEASSTIEANYLKKQQQQELDRQRNLERDYDTATERHKKVIEGYVAELDAVDKFIDQSRKSLETAMKSEFSTYSSKVYDEAKKLVEERHKDKTEKLKAEINKLEELLAVKDKELIALYEAQGQTYNPYENPEYQEYMDENQPETVNSEPEYYEEQPVTENYEYAQPVESQQYYEQANYEPVEAAEPVYYEEQQAAETESYEPEYAVEETITEEPVYEEEYLEPVQEEVEEYPEEINSEETSDDGLEDEDEDVEEFYQETKTTTTEEDEGEQVAPRRGRPRKVVDATEIEPTEKKKPGRPRKETTGEESKEKKPVGRPRKTVTETEPTEKKKPGRPKKVTIVETKKVTIVETDKKKPGRPKKIVEETTVVKRGRGRPKKTETTQNSKIDLNNIDEYIKKIDSEIAEEQEKMKVSQNALDKNSNIPPKK